MHQAPLSVPARSRPAQVPAPLQLSLSPLASAPAPARLGRLVEVRLGDQAAQLAGEALQADLAFAERSGRPARRRHALLDPADQSGVLLVDPAVDPPVEIACRAHL